MLTTGVLAAAIDSLHPGAEADRDAATCARCVPGAPRVDLLEELSRCEFAPHEPASRTADSLTRPRAAQKSWRSSRRSGATFRMPSTWATGSWSAIPWKDAGTGPRSTSAALYVDQKPADDQSAERARSFGFKVYPTIAEALRRGGPKLAVDGVLIIGEHGDYPRNEKGQILYPRYEFFREVADVFEADGRAVPVFNDKHLSYSFAKAKEMVDTSRRLGFPFLAGSSLPVTWRLPPVELPLGCEIDDALWSASAAPTRWISTRWKPCSACSSAAGAAKPASSACSSSTATPSGRPATKDGGRRSCSSRRCPGPTRFQGLTRRRRPDPEPRRRRASSAAWLAIPRPTSSTMPTAPAPPCSCSTAPWPITPSPRGFASPARVVSTQFLLPPIPNVAYSACLMHKVEEMIESGRAPYPVERTLLVSGVLESCLESRLQENRRLETPHLDVHYSPPAIVAILPDLTLRSYKLNLTRGIRDLRYG